MSAIMMHPPMTGTTACDLKSNQASLSGRELSFSLPVLVKYADLLRSAEPKPFCPPDCYVLQRDLGNKRGGGFHRAAAQPR
jgi:hypothetical protein